PSSCKIMNIGKYMHREYIKSISSISPTTDFRMIYILKISKENNIIKKINKFKLEIFSSLFLNFKLKFFISVAVSL
ncbi:hypothetical protein ACXOO8_09335, partial [Streptococcus thermophilus]